VTIGRIVSIKELLPGEPRLPRTTGSGAGGDPVLGVW